MCLKFFNKFSDSMVKTLDKHNASKFKNKDYVVDKEYHKFLTPTIRKHSCKLFMTHDSKVGHPKRPKLGFNSMFQIVSLLFKVGGAIVRF